MTNKWIKSSYSGNQGNCVEVAVTRDAVRDSKNPAGGVLRFGGTALVAFLTRLGEQER